MRSTIAGVIVVLACSAGFYTQEARSVSIPKIAIHVSASSDAQWRYTHWKSWHARRSLRELLVSAGIPSGDIVDVTDAQIDGGALLSGGPPATPTYPILFSLTNEFVSDAVVNDIRAYVLAGGRLYLGSSSFTRRENGTLRLAADGSPQGAFNPDMGLEGSGWVPVAGVQRTTEPSSLASELLANAEIPLILPWSFDLARITTVDSASEGAHWAWALTRETGPAKVLLKQRAHRGFAKLQQLGPWANADEILTFGDVNGDGSDDLLGYRSTTGVARLALSVGREFGPPSTISLNTDETIFLADVSGDGKADLIRHKKTGGWIFIQLSNGSGFNAASSKAISTAYSLFVGDVNGDGRADLVAWHDAPATDVVVALAGTNGDFTNSPFVQQANWGHTGSLYLTDIDGDQRADLVGKFAAPGSPNEIWAYKGSTALRVGVDDQIWIARGKSTGGFEGAYIGGTWKTASKLSHIANVDGQFGADLIGAVDQITRLDTSAIVVPSTGQIPGPGVVPAPGSAFFLAAFAFPHSNWTPVAINPAPASHEQETYMADLNGDGLADVITRTRFIKPPPPHPIVELVPLGGDNHPVRFSVNHSVRCRTPAGVTDAGGSAPGLGGWGLGWRAAVSRAGRPRAKNPSYRPTGSSLHELP